MEMVMFMAALAVETEASGPGVWLTTGLATVAVVLAPAAIIAAGVVALAWWCGWSAARLRVFALVVALCALVSVLVVGWGTTALGWWAGVQSAISGQWGTALAAVWPVELVIGVVWGWWWWSKLKIRLSLGEGFLRGEQHEARMMRHRVRAARWRTHKTYTPLSRGREIILGAAVDVDEHLPRTRWEHLTGRAPGWLKVSTRDIDRHLGVIGSSGSGKTTLLRRLAAGWVEATWEQMQSVAASGHGVMPRPLLIFIECKGDVKAAQDAYVFADQMRALGLDPKRVQVWPFDTRLDMWQMSPNELVESLHALSQTGQAFYDSLDLAALRLIIQTPGGGPKSSLELIERCSEQWLLRAWAHDESARERVKMLAAKAKSGPSNLNILALRLTELMHSIGHDFDAGRSLSDVDALYCVIPGTRSPAMAAAKTGVLKELLLDELNKRPRPTLFIIDEYSAVSHALSVVPLVERVRGIGGSVIVGAQSWEGLGSTEDERRRLVGAMGGGLLVTETMTAGHVAELAGTRRQAENSRHTMGEGLGDEGSSRIQDAFLLDPGRVRRFSPGQVAYVVRGTVTWGVVAQLGRKDAGQASPVVTRSTQRLLPPVGERVDQRQLTDGLAQKLSAWKVPASSGGGWV